MAVRSMVAAWQQAGYFPDPPKGTSGKGKGKRSDLIAKPPPPRVEKAQGDAQVRREWSVVAVDEKPREGIAVVVTAGPHLGRRGVVTKVMGEGGNTRYQVSFGDGKVKTWIDSVQRVVVRGEVETEEPDDLATSRGSWNDPERKSWNIEKEPSQMRVSINGVIKTRTQSSVESCNGGSDVGELITGARTSRAPTSSTVASEAMDAMDTQRTAKTEPALPGRSLFSQGTMQSEILLRRNRCPTSDSTMTPNPSGNTAPSGTSRQAASSSTRRTSNSTIGTETSAASAEFKFQESVGSRHGVPMPTTRNARFKRLVTAEIRAKENLRRGKIEKEKKELQRRKDHYKALSPADVASVPWGQAVEINWVHGGSGGILLVDLGDQGIVIKPQGRTAVSEQLAQLMAPICGVRVAQCKIVKHGEKEHDEIMDIHVKKDVPVVGGDKLKASNIFGKWQLDSGEVAGPGAQYFGVLEYVPGHPLVGEEAQQVLLEPNPTLLRDLGRLCAMDVLLNNMDRVPLPVWSNEGNLGNVMVAAHGGNIIGIDQQVNPIKAGPGFKLYMDKAETLYQSVAGGDPSAVLLTLDKALQQNCGTPLTECQAPHILEGMRECLEAIAAAWNDGSFTRVLDEAVATCRDRFYDPCGHSHDNVVVFDQDELDRMKDFLVRAAQKIAAIAQGPPAET